MRIKEVLEYYKHDRNAIAKDAGVSRVSVGRWIAEGCIPVYRQCKIESSTEGALKSNPKHINHSNHSKKEAKMDFIEKDQIIDEVEKDVEVAAAEEYVSIPKSVIDSVKNVGHLGFYVKVMTMPEDMLDSKKLVEYFSEPEASEEELKLAEESIAAILKALSEHGLIKTQTSFSLK